MNFASTFHSRCTLIATCFAVTASLHGQAVAALGLPDYVLHYQPIGSAVDYPTSVVVANPPLVRLATGTQSPTLGSSQVDKFAILNTQGGSGKSYRVLFYGPQTGPCKIESTLLPNTFTLQNELVETNYWRPSSPEGCGSNGQIGPSPVKWVVEDRVRFNEPKRRKALDGSQYDAIAMTITRAGFPWMTYHWGYRLGMVASESNWSDVALPPASPLAGWPTFPSASNNFELSALPPPWVEGEMIEFVRLTGVNVAPGGQYFYASSDEERALLDDATGDKWERTGRRFKTGGYVSVCGFVVTQSNEPISLFFTTSEPECAALRAAPTAAVAAGTPQLTFQGKPFRASVPLDAVAVDLPLRCPSKTIPLYRAYNNAYTASGKRSFESNHRFSTYLSDINALVNLGWKNEGIVMCVPEVLN